MSGDYRDDFRLVAADTLHGCPFCGERNMAMMSIDPYGQPPDPNRYNYRTCCWSCGATGPSRNTPEKAILAWDTRRLRDLPERGVV